MAAGGGRRKCHGHLAAKQNAKLATRDNGTQRTQGNRQQAHPPHTGTSRQRRVVFLTRKGRFPHAWIYDVLLGLQHRKQAASCVAAPLAQQRQQLLPDTSKQNHEQSPCVLASPRLLRLTVSGPAPPHHAHLSLSPRVSSLSLALHSRSTTVTPCPCSLPRPPHACRHLPLAKISQHSRCPSRVRQNEQHYSSQSPIAVSSVRPRQNPTMP